MFKLIKKLFYLSVLAILAFVITSVFYGGGIARQIGETIGFGFFDNLADKGDAIKYKADSAVGKIERITEEREEKGRQMQRKLKAAQKEHEDLLKGKDQ